MDFNAVRRVVAIVALLGFLVLCESNESSHILKCLNDTNSGELVWADNRLQVVTTRTVNPFVMTVLHNDQDKTVSSKIRDHGLWDPQVLGPMQFILAQGQGRGCEKNKDIVIDVGANIGFFALFALSMKCDVAIFEPQPKPAGAVAASLCLNHASYRRSNIDYQFIPLPVSSKKVVKFPSTNKMHSNNPGGVGAADCNDPKQQDQCQELPTVQLDAFMLDDHTTVRSVKSGTGDGASTHQQYQHESDLRTSKGRFKYQQNVTVADPVKRQIQGKNIKVLKIDAEGFECDVIKTMPMILSNGDVEHILFEMIPHVQGMEENMKAMENLLDMGYVIAECPFSFLEGVRDITQPWIKKVVPLEGKDGVKVLLQQMHDVTEKDRLNWKIKHYTDMWATKDKTMFEKFNDAVIPA